MTIIAAPPPVHDDGEQLRQLVVLKLDGLRYALPLAAVDRVVRAVAVTLLPGAPDGVIGAINVRGEVLPVFDLRRRFGLAGRRPGWRDRLVLARTARRAVAICADEVDSVAAYPAARVIGAAAVVPGLAWVKGVVTLDDGLIVIHDLESFLSLDEDCALDGALADAAAGAS